MSATESSLVSVFQNFYNRIATPVLRPFSGFFFQNGLSGDVDVLVRLQGKSPARMPFDIGYQQGKHFVPLAPFGLE